MREHGYSEALPADPPATRGITAAPLHEGRVVRFGGKDWTAAPLTLGALRRLKPQIDSLAPQQERAAPVNVLDQLDNVLAIVHASLVRNYPDLTVEDLAEQIDISQTAAVVKGVLEASGLVQGDTSGNA